MASAVFKSVKSAGSEPQVKGVAVVEVTDNEGNVSEKEVSFWPSLISQWEASGVKAYVEAEALAHAGFLSDAHTVAAGIPDSGRWIEEHAIPSTPLLS